MARCEIHEEFEKLIDKRLIDVETAVKEYGRLTVSVEKMAVSMENMLIELKDQGERLKTLESQDGEKWRKVTTQVVLCVVTAVVGFSLAKFGF